MVTVRIELLFGGDAPSPLALFDMPSKAERRGPYGLLVRRAELNMLFWGTPPAGPTTQLRAMSIVPQVPLRWGAQQPTKAVGTVSVPTGLPLDELHLEWRSWFTRYDAGPLPTYSEEPQGGSILPRVVVCEALALWHNLTSAGQIDTGRVVCDVELVELTPEEWQRTLESQVTRASHA